MQYKGKRTLLATTALALIAMVLLTAGCSAVVQNPVVAKVGDVEISYSQFANTYSMYQTYYSYGLIALEGDDPKAELKSMTFDALINSVLPIAAAHKAGVKLTAEEEAEADKLVQEGIEEALAEYAEKVDASITDEAAIREAEMKLFVEELKGYKMTYDEYVKAVTVQERNSMLSQKMKDQVTASAAVTEEEARAWFDTELKAQQEEYASNPASYYDDKQAAGYSGGMEPFVAPQGYFYVKHILIKNPDEGVEKDVKAIAASVEEQIKAGIEFDVLIDKYNEDEGMKNESNANGYLMSEAIASKYEAPFSEAALKLALNEVSGPVESVYGIHFIKRVADVDTTPVSFDSLKEKVTQTLLDGKQNELYQAALEQWQKDITVVRYEKRVKNVGSSTAQ